jgi:hypothetical protein
MQWACVTLHGTMYMRAGPSPIPKESGGIVGRLYQEYIEGEYPTTLYSTVLQPFTGVTTFVMIFTNAGFQSLHRDALIAVARSCKVVLHIYL